MILQQLINEMANVRQRNKLRSTKWQYSNDVVQWLHKQGFSDVGSGYYANVFHSPRSNKVVKVTRKQDICYNEYIEFVIKNQNNKHLPKVYDHVAYVDPHAGHLNITVLEKLYPIPFKQLLNKRNKYLLAWLAFNDMLPDEMYDPVEKLLGIDDPYGSYEQIEPYSTRFEQSRNSLAVTYRKILQLASFCDTDLHDDNIMWRKSDSSIVFTDPLAS